MSSFGGANTDKIAAAVACREFFQNYRVFNKTAVLQEIFSKRPGSQPIDEKALEHYNTYLAHGDNNLYGSIHDSYFCRQVSIEIHTTG